MLINLNKLRISSIAFVIFLFYVIGRCTIFFRKKFIMKIEIDNSQLINDIVEKVVARLKPLLNNPHDSKYNELMTVDEVARYLKTKKSTIYDKVHSRTIPFLKNGGSSRFRRTHIDLWLINPYHPDLSIYNLNHNGRR